MKKTKKIPRSRSKSPRAVVVIAASAGGLAGFTQLLGKLKADLDCAFVLLQHLDPKHHSQLGEILQANSSMILETVTRPTKPRANRVYVMPSESYLRWQSGSLKPVARDLAPGQMPFDKFFSSLARDKTIPRIGVLLSGMNADGAAGLAALRKAGGLTLVLDPRATQFSTMPESAIAKDAADHVLSLRKITELLNGLEPAKLRSLKATRESTEDDSEGLSPILDLLFKESGVDFSGYKVPTLSRRIRRNMTARKHASIKAYAAFLRAHPKELRRLFEEVTIHVTKFFRDPESFGLLESRVIPALVKAKPEGSSLRVWVAGCATGQEVYSLGILLLEAAGRRGISVRIFGTDISEASIRFARAGCYSEEMLADIPAPFRRKYFSRTEAGYVVQKALRNACMFARQDLIHDPAFSQMDLISCRNVLIYLGAEAQKKALQTLEAALRPGGYLFLGSSESLGPAEKHFQAVNRKCRLFQKIAGEEGAPSAGKPAKRRVKARVPEVKFTAPKALRDLHRKLELSVKRERERDERGGRRTVEELESEIRSSRVHFRGLLESQSTLYEELQASHEELMVTNDELSVNNEELEVLQEELQAANEELRTVNDEIQNRNTELDEHNQRMEKLTSRLREAEEYSSALVQTVRQPLLVLDEQLRVVSANRAFYRTFEVTRALTEGRLFYDLGNQQWNIPELRALLEEVLPDRTVVEDYEVTHKFLRLGLRTMLLNARRVLLPKSERQLILLAIDDVTLRANERRAMLHSKESLQAERDHSHAENTELRLERALREKFVLALSHDLRNPLTGAKLSAQLLLRRSSPDDATRRTIERIVENMNRADQMITDLLDANRIKAGQGILVRRRPLDLTAFLKGEKESFALRFGERLRWEIEGEGLTGSWDPDAIRRILENLVSNAFKYGLDPEEVTVRVRPTDGHAEICVHNEGEPIPPEDQRTLFEQFRRTESSRRGGKEGWGIGLTLVRGLAEAHEGWVGLESSAEAGTTFTVCLPR